ncbi:hypothetical protein BB561_004266 [Smittium simulii]|uniref:Mediator of RNA polymerase II transcription subunit 9 n=1 Tax=Smittium simulii TaxID=133385 RepID=A0A2T9YH72_9FUNG|nr:hypothetical protein BB561_004266 [Smittium simulii]
MSRENPADDDPNTINSSYYSEFLMEGKQISYLEDIHELFKLCAKQEDSRKQITDLMTKLTDKMQVLQNQVSNLPGIHLSIREQLEILEQEQQNARKKAENLCNLTNPSSSS